MTNRFTRFALAALLMLAAFAFDTNVTAQNAENHTNPPAVTVTASVPAPDGYSAHVVSPTESDGIGSNVTADLRQMDSTLVAEYGSRCANSSDRATCLSWYVLVNEGLDLDALLHPRRVISYDRATTQQNGDRAAQKARLAEIVGEMRSLLPKVHGEANRQRLDELVERLERNTGARPREADDTRSIPASPNAQRNDTSGGDTSLVTPNFVTVGAEKRHRDTGFKGGDSAGIYVGH